MKRIPLVHLLAPYRCVICGTNLFSEKIPLCGPCADKLVPNLNKGCIKCGKTLISEIELCLRCRDRDFSFDSSFSLFPYSSFIKDLLKAYKFHGVLPLADYFSGLIYDAHKLIYADIPVIPVPGGVTGIKLRGWDHIDKIADRLEAQYGINICRCLKRKPGKAQKTLTYEERLKNLENKIGFIPIESGLPSEAVLMDDVFTTGATLNECAKVLKTAGIKRVYSITLAID